MVLILQETSISDFINVRHLAKLLGEPPEILPHSPGEEDVQPAREGGGRAPRRQLPASADTA